MWRNGTYMISYYQPGNKFLNSPIFISACNILNNLLVLGIAVSFWKGAKDDNDPLIFPRIIICGVFMDRRLSVKISLCVVFLLNGRQPVVVVILA